MGKNEVSYETHPELYHYRPGTTEPELRPEVVQAEAEAEKQEAAQPKGKLPEDFPGHGALEAAGITTYAQLRKAGDVTEIPGIGKATAEKIAAELGESNEEESVEAETE